jgi:hypothetical protein
VPSRHTRYTPVPGWIKILVEMNLSERRENTPMLALGMNTAILILFYLSEKIPAACCGKIHFRRRRIKMLV